MLMDVIAMIATGAGMVGVAMALWRPPKHHLPGWAIAALFGFGMAAYAIWNDYTWFPRVTGVLPPEVVVIEAPTSSSPWRPWSYLVPLRLRFTAFDGTSLQPSASNPAIRQGEVVMVERGVPTRRIPVAFDCAQGMQADLGEGASLAADGSLGGGAEWRQAVADDPLQAAACQER